MSTFDLVVTTSWETGDEGVSEAEVSSLVRHALTEEQATGDWEVNFRFTSDHEIARLHDEFMDDPTPTDIITFPFDEDGDPFGGVPGGDIVISVETAASHALDAGWSTLDEVRFLILHGVLHLTGWDDATKAERASMLARQRVLLDSWTGRSG